MKWKLEKLGDVCEVIAGQSPPSSTYNASGNGMPFFQGKADFGTVTPVARYWCTEPTKVSQPNDVLLSVRAPVGPTNFCNIQSCIGRGLAAIRSIGKTDPKFVLYYFKSIERDLSTKGNGSTFSAITTSDVKNLQIPLPPLPTQQKIAAILDEADALRRKDKALLAKYDELLQAVFYDMFGDPVKNEKGWEVKKLNSLIKFLTSGSRGWAKYYKEAGDVFLRINNVGKNNLLLNDIVYVDAPDGAEGQRTKVETGDILLSITADLGRTAVIPDNFPLAYINQHLALIRLKEKSHAFYISEYIASDGGKKQLLKSNKGGVKAGLNFDDVRQLEIPLPPAKIQSEFAKIATSIQHQKSQIIQQQAYSESLFQSLMQQAFKGDLVG